MAKTSSFRSSGKAFYLLGLSCVFSFIITNGNAFEFKVGGPTAKWQVPSDPSAAAYNQWAENNRFQVGDTLLFIYSPDQDSVLQVTKEDYANCNTSSPLANFSDGHTVYKFKQSGPHYFISGTSDHCQKNEKLIVVVLAQRNNKNNHNSNGTQPPSPPPEANVPPPSPAPAGEEPPSPPPSGVETNPAAAPSEESSPADNNNGGSSIVGGGVGIIAALVASSLVLAV